MWRSVTGERPRGSSGGARASPAPGPELASVGLYSQDSPLLGLLSAVSRPAVSFLQRWSPYLPGRVLKQDFVEPESEFLRQLDDILPPQQLHSLPWINLSELGIHSPEGPEGSHLHTQTVVSHVLIHPPRGISKTWLGGLWGSVEDERLRAAGAKRAAAIIHKDAGVAVDKTSLPPGPPALSPALIHYLGLSSESPALDLDNGYSSLEEEQLLAAKAQLQSTVSLTAEEEEEESEEVDEAELEAEEDIPVLKCDNKAIAFIMGCPCSDDSGSDSSEDEDEEDDDDGFDSECSSDISDSDDEDEEEDEFDSEAERLWSALCQNQDPYNPRNFTAKLGSSPSAPRPIPRAAGPELDQVQSSPGTSVASSVASSASSSSWDEASETEGEQESLKLLGAFCSSDPYSPLNFQATIRTRPGLDPKPDSKVDPKPDRRPEEERVRKISESSHSSTRATSRKKQVRFLAEVQVFAVGCEERRGPWEELARDRARFAKRCCETEELLSACLQPEHRRRVYLRVCGYYGPTAGPDGATEE